MYSVREMQLKTKIDYKTSIQLEKCTRRNGTKEKGHLIKAATAEKNYWEVCHMDWAMCMTKFANKKKITKHF